MFVFLNSFLTGSNLLHKLFRFIPPTTWRTQSHEPTQTHAWKNMASTLSSCKVCLALQRNCPAKRSKWLWEDFIQSILKIWNYKAKINLNWILNSVQNIIMNCNRKQKQQETIFLASRVKLWHFVVFCCLQTFVFICETFKIELACRMLKFLESSPKPPLEHFKCTYFITCFVTLKLVIINLHYLLYRCYFDFPGH